MTSCQSSSISIRRNYDSLLAKRGYTLNETIGTGSYAKVK